jgi:hypothetical protein
MVDEISAGQSQLQIHLLQMLTARMQDRAKVQGCIRKTRRKRKHFTVDTVCSAGHIGGRHHG